MGMSRETLGAIFRGLGQAGLDINDILIAQDSERKSLAREMMRVRREEAKESERYRRQEERDKAQQTQRATERAGDTDVRLREGYIKEETTARGTAQKDLDDPNTRYNRYYLRGEEPPGGFSDMERQVFQSRFRKDTGAESEKSKKAPRDYVSDSIKGFTKVQSTRSNIEKENYQRSFYKDREPLADPYSGLPQLGSSLDYFNAVNRRKVMADPYFSDPSGAADSISVELGGKRSPMPVQMGEELQGPELPNQQVPDEIDLTPQVEAAQWQSLSPAQKVDSARVLLSQTDGWEKRLPDERAALIEAYVTQKGAR